MDRGPYALGLQNATLMIQSGPALTQDPWGANNQDNTSFATNEFKKPKQLHGKNTNMNENKLQTIGKGLALHNVNWSRTMLISISG